MSRDPGSNQCIETEATTIRLNNHRKMTLTAMGQDQIDTRYFFFLRSQSYAIILHNF